mmetsp:Transcript_18481/g.73801  ORF Transcript_18481/g.73801 Transcript_18481/m.73801 type:complete len:217 (+) Transcript_18481:2-652(+)
MGSGREAHGLVEGPGDVGEAHVVGADEEDEVDGVGAHGAVLEEADHGGEVVLRVERGLEREADDERLVGRHARRAAERVLGAGRYDGRRADVVDDGDGAVDDVLEAAAEDAEGLVLARVDVHRRRARRRGAARGVAAAAVARVRFVELHARAARLVGAADALELVEGAVLGGDREELAELAARKQRCARALGLGDAPDGGDRDDDDGGSGQRAAPS